MTVQNADADLPFALKQILTCLDLALKCGDDEMARHLCDLARAFTDYAIRHSSNPQLVAGNRCVKRVSRRKMIKTRKK